ncbi:hypothetical protein EVAR_19374_1 [Eumeta japonica]|uniref:Uncharacterized protein n=1 Tax=Eumeta variegata TaxID=151549 RepID=A0A4C1TRI2_EUMVA|nr:hypothetical protein EVAR_19374_1 [Eumeta japonica]
MKTRTLVAHGARRRRRLRSSVASYTHFVIGPRGTASIAATLVRFDKSDWDLLLRTHVVHEERTKRATRARNPCGDLFLFFYAIFLKLHFLGALWKNDESEILRCARISVTQNQQVEAGR